jgi:glucosylceramidase
MSIHLSISQEIIGFGGAFTEAAAHNFFKLSPEAQKKFLEAYFGEEGIAYTLGRIHINSCDFSLESYSFNDVKDDFKVIRIRFRRKIYVVV